MTELNQAVQHSGLSRRQLLAGIAAAFACCRLHAQPETGSHGRLKPPVLLPDFEMVTANGSKSTLHRILGEQATAIQLMFTACRTTCPMEGATFQKVQKLIPDMVERKVQLLSISTNAGGEKSGDLLAWMHRFDAHEGWTAAAPATKDMSAFVKIFGEGRSPTDPHSTQVQIVDRHHQLIWRTTELPPATEVAAILKSFSV